MKSSFWIVLLFIVVCTTSWSVKPPDIEQLQGDWMLTKFQLAGGDSTVVFKGKTPVIRFDTASLNISGSTGCNKFSGPFRKTKDQLKFDMEKMALTRMACSGDGERIFLEGLKKVTHYKIIEHTLLMLADNTVIMSWQKNK